MMSITVHCTHCRTAFPVDPAKVPEGGVRVRCTVCEGIFRVEKTLPRPEASEMDVVEPAAESMGAQGMEPVVQDVPDPQSASGTVSPEGPGVEEDVGITVDMETEEGDHPRGAPEVDVESTREESTGADEDATRLEEEIEPIFDEDVETRRDEETEASVEPEDERVSEEDLESEIEEDIESAFEEEAGALVDRGVGPVGDGPATPATEEIPEALGDLETEPPPEVELETPEDLDIEPSEEAAVTTEDTEAPKGFQFGRRDPHDKARRLARVLVSDMITYNPERHRRALAEGTLEEDFREEIDRSWKEYTSQVGREIAENTDYWTEALNEILAGDEDLF